MDLSLQNLSIHQLKTFLEVAHCGSLTRAASRLGYAQSSVTVHVRTLERCLGVRLFHRLPQGVRLTPEGEVVVTYATQVFRVIEEMGRAVKQDAGVNGKARLAGPAVLTNYYLGPVLRQCRQNFPNLQLSTRTVSPGEVERVVRAGEVDVGFMLSESADDSHARTGPLHWKTLCRVEFIPVCSAAGADSRRCPPLQEGVLVDDPECVAQKVFAREVQRRLGGPARIVEIGSIAGVLESLESGPAVGLLPRVAARDLLERGEAEIDHRLPTVTRVFARAVWRPEMSGNAAVRSIVRTAAGVLSAAGEATSQVGPGREQGRRPLLASTSA